VPRSLAFAEKKLLSATKAISDETRIRILHLLSFGSFSVNEIVEILGMGQSRISRHLKILSEAGLVSTRKEGSLVFSTLPEAQYLSDFAVDLTKLLLSYKEDLPFREIDQRMVTSILEKRERKSKGFFDQVAEEGGLAQDEHLHPRLYRDWILQSLPRGASRILDLGCGDGSLLSYLLAYAKQVIGVDSSPKMIEKADKLYKNNPSVELVQANLENLPFPECSVDSVVASMVLHHISHPPVVLGEVFRILRPGGVLSLVDLEKHEEEFMREEYFDLWLGFEKELLESWMVNAGFQLLSVQITETDSYFKILQIKAKKKEDIYVHSN